MTNVLPQQAGLTVDSVFYRYTTVKNPEDDMLVHVQNENANGEGYIFRSTDDWSGLPGNTINKAVAVNGIPIDSLGDGSIEVEGTGEVVNAKVVYNYQFDPCFDPQSDPTCPDYVSPFSLDMLPSDPEVVDPLDQDYVQDELDRKAMQDDEDEEEQDRKQLAKEKKKDDRLEKVLGIVNTSLLSADSIAKHNELIALNYIPQTYFESLPDTKYEETIVLKDSKLPENKKGKRVGLAQQVLHEQMVSQQYER